jgi:uncharacterized protein (TIGR02453 family)
MRDAFITPALFRFLTDLRQHNDRDWFNAHKDEYVSHVRDPLLAFVSAIAPKLRAISPHIVADLRASGGSLLRIYRDTRFSRDKKPYKTNAALSFRLAPRRDIESPGYYLHLEPGLVFMGAGMWHPSADALHAVRQAIVGRPREWKGARRSGLTHGEEALKRPPRGYAADHQLIEDLKQTSFTVGEQFTERQACGPGFPDVFIRACRREAPLIRFLARAMNLPF